MRQKDNLVFGSVLETTVYPLLLLSLLWSIFLLEQFYPKEFVQFGILPKTLTGLKGILFSPLIHSPQDIGHLINNSLSLAILLGTLIYFYHPIASKIFFLSWFLSGFLVWLIAKNTGSYHIGFSGVIYSLAAFLFTSGTIRKFKPLQAISLFVVFVYGSMIWGIFPLEDKISWEGHLFGLITGVFLAFMYKKQGPQRQKYQYEIEKDLGIAPPDLEAIWLQHLQLYQEQNQNHIFQNEENEIQSQSTEILTGKPPRIQYEYQPKKSNLHQDDTY